MRRYIFTKEHLDEMIDVIPDIQISEDGKAFMLTTKTNNPTYKNGTRTDTVGGGLKEFTIVKGRRLKCMRDPMIEAIERGYNPIRLMMELNNYGVRVGMFITQRNIADVMQATEALLKPDDKRSVEERIIVMQATIE